MRRMNEKFRDGVTDADATGMVADEEHIAEVETMLPLLQHDLPREDLHAALPAGHDAHATIDALHTEMQGDKPNKATVEQHVGTLRLLPELEAIVVNWWDNPSTQRFFDNLARTGL